MSDAPVITMPAAEPVPIQCRCCGHDRDLDEYRLFKIDPAMYMDFCVHCEQQSGTITLYRRYNAYGTPEIIKAVFAADRTPEPKRSEEQVRLLVTPKTNRAPKTNEELVKRELQRRDLARRRLIAFTKAFHPDYKPGWVHQDLCRRLERFIRQVEEGASPRLMVFMPPRVGKSTLASEMFPAWALGHHPEWSIIAASYAQSLSVGFSRRIRDHIDSKEYQAIFSNTNLRSDSRGVEEWDLTAGGKYIAAGVGSGVTGKGGHILIYDDPVKDQEAASSDVIREATYNWYVTTFRTRVAPGGGILGIQTRWHHHDLSGRLLDDDALLAKAGVPEAERENWEVVVYPALAEADERLMRNGEIMVGEVEDEDAVLRLLRRKGEALHPERYNTSELVKLRNTMPSSNWNALYQQRPTPDEGDFFQRSDFKYRWLDPAWRPLARVFMTADYAISKKDRRDFTVLSVFALTHSGELYVLDVRRGRWGTYDIASNVVALAEKHKPELYAGEQGAIHHAVWPVVQRELDAKRISLPVDDSLVPIADSETRARPLQGLMQRGKVLFSYDEATRPEIYDIVERELLQFPNGVHDDCVDSLAWGARLSMNLSLPTEPDFNQRRDSWEDQYMRTGTRSYMTA